MSRDDRICHLFILRFAELWTFFVDLSPHGQQSDRLEAPEYRVCVDTSSWAAQGADQLRFVCPAKAIARDGWI